MSHTPTWFITGCDKGLGRAIAEAALRRGHQVALTVLAADGHSPLVEQYPGRCRAYALDVRNAAQVRAVVAEAEQAFGAIDVLVNNAGYGLVGAAEETTEGSVAKNRLKAERALTIFSETFDERFQMASF